MKKYVLLIALMLLISLQGCDFLGSIFTTGVGVGVFIAVIVVIIIFIIARMVKK